MSDVKLIQGDCLTIMPQLAEQGIKADMVLTDPPYGVTNCKWDSVIPIDEMWDSLHNITNEDTPILLFGTNPFLANLIMSNVKEFKFNFIWDKKNINNPFLCNTMPLKSHEEIAVFYKKKPYYNPQRIPKRIDYDNSRTSDKSKRIKEYDGIYGTSKVSRYYVDDGTRYPQSVISQFSGTMGECNNTLRCHPTQKPVALLEWLIKNYTKENDLVLDFTMGSGSTGVACLQTNRKFIGIELEPKYYEIAKKRINEAKAQRRLI